MAARPMAAVRCAVARSLLRRRSLGQGHTLEGKAGGAEDGRGALILLIGRPACGAPGGGVGGEIHRMQVHQAAFVYDRDGALERTAVDQNRAAGVPAWHLVGDAVARQHVVERHRPFLGQQETLLQIVLRAHRAQRALVGSPTLGRCLWPASASCGR